jgi:mRNA interferase MazF
MNRSEVWLIRLDPTVGDEIGKMRPAVIVNDSAVGYLELRVVVPLTGWKDHFVKAPWMVRIDPDTATGLAKTSAADAFQVRSLSVKRFNRMIGILTDDQMVEIKAALAAVFDIDLDL